jgi:hypothetical protein
VQTVRSAPDTPRQRALPDADLSQIRAHIERHIRNTYLKKVQAPVGVKPILRAWLEIA